MIVSDTPSPAAHRIDASSSVIPHGSACRNITCQRAKRTGAAAKLFAFDGDASRNLAAQFPALAVACDRDATAQSQYSSPTGERS